MRCFHILLHGRLSWTDNAPRQPMDTPQPAGFVCNRFVLASDQEAAVAKAKARETRIFDSKTGWLREGKAALTLEVEEVSKAPLLKGLWPANQGYAFYASE